MSEIEIIRLIRQHLSRRQIRDIFDEPCSKNFFVPDGHQTQYIISPYYMGDYKYRIEIRSKRRSLEQIVYIAKSELYN